MTVFLHPEAELELRDAVTWYDRQKIGLGDEFIKCLDEAIERIRDNPKAFPEAHKSIRRVVIRRFPFAIFFESFPGEIRILAIFHSRRDPGRWKKRK